MRLSLRLLINVLATVAVVFHGNGADFSFNPSQGSEAPKHEMRGAWLATVYGIDWPSKQGVTAAVAEEQRRELREILDVLQASGINAVMFQVRLMSDALYPSKFEPWSQWLTGSRGAAPAKGWNPLEFAVAEAHARGMELHAWVNPFRLANGAAPVAVRAASGRAVFDPVGKGWVIAYGQTEKIKTAARGKGKKGKRTNAYTTKTKWTSILDPGNPEARRHIVDVCREIITDYDVDGLVFDDYFYPDRLPLGDGYDYAEWIEQTTPEGGGEPSMSQADWRRDNVARTIAEVSEMVRKERPWVRFGVAPAGVGGGNGAATQPYGLRTPEVGKDWMYDRIFCDPVRWLADGSVDYVSPQIYWACDHATNPYEPIARWWADVAIYFGRHCYPSQKVLALPAGAEAWGEQCREVEVNRHASSGIGPGEIFYSSAHLSGKQAYGLGEALRSEVFEHPALLPVTPWKEATNPGAVQQLVRKGNRLSWYPQPDMRYVVYAIPSEVGMIDAVSPDGANFATRYIQGIVYGHSFDLAPDKIKNHWFAVAPYDRYGNEWEPAIIGL